jgi:glycosyltransferase involved in cell wall biosynthesis
MRKDVIFVVVGEDRVCYGGDRHITRGRSFKQWVLSKRDYDLSRFFFTGWLSGHALTALLAGTDVHVYLTVPFVLSWSLMNALACGATVVASDTPPVHEMITHGRNGLLVDFFDVEGFAMTVSSVLDSADDYAHLGAAAVDFVNNHAIELRGEEKGAQLRPTFRPGCLNSMSVP